VSKMIMDESVAADDLAEAVDGPLIEEMVSRARSQGLELTGPNGLLGALTKRVLESALEGEITDHLGYDKHERAGHEGGNSRNGTRSKTVPLRPRTPSRAVPVHSPRKE
jgi:putative transposase